MPQHTLTEEQRSQIEQRAASVAEWRHEEELERRRRVGREFCSVLDQSGVHQGRTLDPQRFCELIGLLWQVENLNPQQMPKLLGTYRYRVHFADYEGTEEDLVAEYEEVTGGGIYGGADLATVSESLRLMAGDTRDDHARGTSLLLEVDGAGPALVSGFLHLLHPEQYGIINTPTRKPFVKGGLLDFKQQQRSAAAKQCKEWFSEDGVASPAAVRRVFRWQALLDEMRELCGMDDYFEVDQFLWTLSNEPDREEVDRRITEAVAAIQEDDYRTRVEGEAVARRLLESKAGRFSAEDLKRFLEHINKCHGKNGVVSVRFGPGFVGHNRKLMLEHLDQINTAVASLWNAAEEEVPRLLTGFWESSLPGAGRGFPSAILYLKEKEKYAVWGRKFESVLWSVLPGLASNHKTGFAYMQYCDGVQQLRRRLGFAPEMHDFVLFKLMEKSPPRSKSGEGEFKGFGEDAFRFLQELEKNNNESWFEANRSRYKDSLDKPLRSLVKDVGEQAITPLDPNFETTPTARKCIASIRKNIYGKAAADCYNPFYWAAYYQKGLRKQDDCQLFILLRPDGLSFGLYIPKGGDRFREQLATAMRHHPELCQSVYERVRSAGFEFQLESQLQADPGGEGVDYAELTEAVPTEGFRAAQQLSPTDAVAAGATLSKTIGDAFEVLYPLYKLITSSDPAAEVPPLIEDDALIEPPSITVADLAEKTLLEESFFEHLDLLLSDKRQLIFCGPPGTSKTFVAKEYAGYLAQGGGEVRTVQFHPSYGYEDFIEGLRPVASQNGSLDYRVEAGVFKRLCDAARTNPKQRYVLIIDEINRGNIPRVFGELLYLLENRGSTVDLPYSKKPFSVPKNVVILGTMNSSDRSIALMDLALRRRFHFVKMGPRPDILRNWLADTGKPSFIHELFTRLNERLERAGVEADRLVGHAHFMSHQIDEEFLELVWAGTIEPLLEEYFVAEPQRMTEFQLDVLRDEVAEEDELEEDEDDSDGDDSPLDEPETFE